MKYAGRIGLAAMGVGTVLMLGGCFKDKNIVDGKAVVEVPGGDVCYLLEIDRESGGSGEEMAESYVCVSKAEWDKNQVDGEWVGANGKKK
jgi:hypothetical protein